MNPEKDSILEVEIFYVGEFSFPTYWYIDHESHQVRGEMYIDHESTALFKSASDRPVVSARTVRTRGFDTREEFEAFAKGHEVLMDYVFDWPELEKRYGVQT